MEREMKCETVKWLMSARYRMEDGEPILVGANWQNIPVNIVARYLADCYQQYQRTKGANTSA